MPTPSTPIRFTPEDLTKIDLIRDYLKAQQGFSSRAAAVRWAVHQAAQKIPKKNRKKT